MKDGQSQQQQQHSAYSCWVYQRKISRIFCQNVIITMSSKWPLVKKKISHVVWIILLSTPYFLQLVESGIVTNKMRYATSEKSIENKQLSEQAMEYAASNIRSLEKPMQSGESYRINRDIHKNDNFHEGTLLNEEDRNLLEEFYRETKDRDPFDGEALSTEDLWNEHDSNSINSLIDSESQKLSSNPETVVKSELNNGWTIDADYFVPLDGAMKENSEITSTSNHLANYSPTLKLLTTYNPLREEKILENSSRGRIVGATLYGQDETTMPKVNSKSATNAIKLHDELMKQPPRDGKVRVRMYYHRAIHDDARLYGNGPWKYWGHGWGVEFGYDPKKTDKNDFYQKGYTIERAFGRDFCKDKINCRQSDPDFFRDPKKVGHYSRKYAKILPKKVGEYKISE